jgi:hypothetical protein
MRASLPRVAVAGEPAAFDTEGMDPRLQEIIDRGSPAQVELARRLQATGAVEQIGQLYDAYLNDPYLTRY